MLNTSLMPQPPKPQFITMKDSHGNVEEIPVEQENIITIFKAMGYREVPMVEIEPVDE